MEAFITQFSGPMMYLAYFIFLILCGLGNPIPEDLIMITGGYLVFSGLMNPAGALIVSYVGVLTGDFMLYYFGRKYGQKIIEHRWLQKIVPENRVALIRTHFKKWGHWTIFFARFLPGLRSPTFLLSGVMHVRFRDFALLDALGTLISVPLFVGLGYFFGNHIEVLRHDIHQFRSIAVIIAITLIIAYVLYLWRSERTAKITE